jgi:hypothetical protein
MTQSVYVIGAAGTGKSTFTGELLSRLDVGLGPLEDLHAKPNARGNLVTLRGHRMSDGNSVVGLYLGVMREEFPGSDGLDRASSPTGEEWLFQNQEGFTGSGELPQMIVAEGATLATRRFLNALNLTTDLLVLALRCDPMIHDLRLLQRGAGQVSSFVQSTVTKTDNLVRDLEKQSARVRWVDTDEPDDWEDALLSAQEHLAS